MRILRNTGADSGASFNISRQKKLANFAQKVRTVSSIFRMEQAGGSDQGDNGRDNRPRVPDDEEDEEDEQFDVTLAPPPPFSRSLTLTFGPLHT